MAFWNKKKYWLWSYVYNKEGTIGVGRAFLISDGHVNIVSAENETCKDDGVSQVSTIALTEISKISYMASLASMAELEKAK